ncbi:MAG: hypothetical protein ACTSVY_04505 [Candidatus Helarchaeota archaeon]
MNPVIEEYERFKNKVNNHYKKKYEFHWGEVDILMNGLKDNDFVLNYYKYIFSLLNPLPKKKSTYKKIKDAFWNNNIGSLNSSDDYYIYSDDGSFYYITFAKLALIGRHIFFTQILKEKYQEYINNINFIIILGHQDFFLILPGNYFNPYLLPEYLHPYNWNNASGRYLIEVKMVENDLKLYILPPKVSKCPKKVLDVSNYVNNYNMLISRKIKGVLFKKEDVIQCIKIAILIASLIKRIKLSSPNYKSKKTDSIKRHCAFCGREVPVNAEFCPACGDPMD